MRLVFFLLALTAALSACSLRSSPEPKIEVSAEHLAAMVLRVDDFEPDYQAFAKRAESGPRTIEQLIEGADDPDDEALDVAKFGHLMNHADSYASNANIIRGSGAIMIADGIILYRDAKGAAGDLDDIIADAKRDFSGTTELGSLQSFKLFKAKAGEEGHGLTMRFLTPGVEFGLNGLLNLTVTAVYFRRDNLVAGVMMMRLDTKDVQAEVNELARKLDRRIKSVLAGESPDSDNVAVPDAQPPAAPAEGY